MAKERENLHIPGSRISLNVAQFISVVSSLTEGCDIKHPENDLPEHFSHFQNAFNRTGELSLIGFDMDNLTATNSQYTHLHGSIICSMFEKSALEIVEPNIGLFAAMGEENIAALPIKMEDAYVVANTIINQFTAIPFDFGAGEFHQGVSAGVASLSHSDPHTFRHIMELQSGALVYSKRTGKGRATMFGDK